MADEGLLPWLDRPRVTTDLSWLANKKVLVTGAGGSIGGELCRQLAPLWAEERLWMLDRDDNGLYRTLMAIDRRCEVTREEVVLADVTDRSDMTRVFQAVRPDVVFHAAAFKDVVLGQTNPLHVAIQNVMGTHYVARAASMAGVSTFVNVSTDKAADPVNVMGATKRLAERMIASFCDPRFSSPRFLSVRFGNVVGSVASATDLFRRQIADGGPVTLVDPEVTRYWMTLAEAVSLVLTAGRHSPGATVSVLDMGPPVKVADVVDQLMLAAGQTVLIDWIGLRPGEKLHEVLLSEEERPYARRLLDDDGRRLPIDVVPVVPISPTEAVAVAGRLGKGRIDPMLHDTGLAAYLAATGART